MRIFAVMICFAIPASDLQAATYRVGYADAGFPPYSFAAKDERAGIFQQILEAVGRETGDAFVPVYAPTKRLQKLFAAGDIDIEPGINPIWRPEQAAISIYSRPFTDLVSRLLFHEASGPVSLRELTTERKIQRPDGKPVQFLDPNARLIATVRGYRYTIFDDGFANGMLKRFDTEGEKQQILMLNSRRVDAIAQAEIPARFFIKELGVTTRLNVVIGEETDRTPIMFRMLRTHKTLLERLDRVIETMTASGRIKAIEQSFLAEISR